MLRRHPLPGIPRRSRSIIRLLLMVLLGSAAAAIAAAPTSWAAHAENRAAFPPFTLAQGKPGAVRPSPPGSVQTQQAQLESARRYLRSGKRLLALETLQKMIAAPFPDPSVAEAYWLLGQILSEMDKPEEAKAYLRRLVEEYPASEFAWDARLALAAGFLKAGQVEPAIPLLVEAKNLASTPAGKLTALRQLEHAYLMKQDYARAVDSALESRPLSPEDSGRYLEERVRQFVEQAGEADLRRIADKYPQGFPGDVALLRVLDLQVAAGENYKVTRTARQFLKRFPTHEQTAAITDILIAQRLSLKAKDLLIGALLPLSGPLQSYGNEVHNGVRMALDEAVQAAPELSLGLVAKDTEGDDALLTMELHDLLEDYRPVAVIGPLLTRNVQTVAAAADDHRVVFVTPTATLPEVQRLSPYLFNTAVNNRALVRDLAGYAVESMRWRRVGILAPQDVYGTEMAQAFAEEVGRLGGEVIATETYAPEQTDFGPAIKRMKEEDLQRYGKLEPVRPGKNVKAAKGKPVKVYTPGFDAIFLPAEASKAGLIAGQLLFHGIKVPFLGTNGMNSPELIRIGARAVEGTVFADSFFVDSPDLAVRNFVDLYMKRFKEPPSAFAAQAYEAAQLVLDAVLYGASTGDAVREHLMAVRTRPGVSGLLTMHPDGYLERRYPLAQVKSGKFVLVTSIR